MNGFVSTQRRKATRKWRIDLEIIEVSTPIFIMDYRGMGRTFEVIYQTRETVFHRDIQTPRRELKIRRAAEYF